LTEFSIFLWFLLLVAWCLHCVYRVSIYLLLKIFCNQSKKIQFEYVTRIQITDWCRLQKLESSTEVFSNASNYLMILSWFNVDPNRHGRILRCWRMNDTQSPDSGNWLSCATFYIIVIWLMVHNSVWFMYFLW